MGVNAVSSSNNEPNTTQQTNNGVKSKIFNIFSDSYTPSALEIGGTIFAGILIGAVAGRYGLKALKSVNKKSFNAKVLEQAHSDNVQSVDIGLTLSSKLDESHKVVKVPTDSLFGTIREEQPHTINVSKLSPKKVGYNMSEEEISFYDSVISDYRELYPIKRQCNPYTDIESLTTQHISGDVSEVAYRLDKYADRSPFPCLSLRSNGKHLDIMTKESKIYGDEQLIEEYKDFLNGNTPNEKNFHDFLRHRDLNYVRENGITDIKPLEVSRRKGAEIEKAEKLYHEERQNMYSNLWRPYPTEQFYRVIGMDELIKLLRGQEIVSKTSQARYGRSCVDITTNPYYHHIFYGETKFRIPFKRKTPDGHYNTDFTSRIHSFNPEKAHYQIPSYNINDVNVQEIKYWNGSNWQYFDIDEVIRKLG